MTHTSPSEFTKEVGAEPLPGYRLVEPLGKGGYGEVWKCEVPGGLFKAVKFVRGEETPPGHGPTSLERELEAFQSIKAVRHPFILSIERVELVGGEMVTVMELADKNLQDRLAECQAGGLPGVPRQELLAFLLEAAEALDVMNFRHGLLHLDVKPTNLFVVSDHLKVGDFGLVNRLGPRGEQAPAEGGVTPLYVAPEVLQNKIHRNSDQYNLALAYQELLTGVHPFWGDNPRKVMAQHLLGQPNLAPLPEADRPWVARALAKEPAKRFPSCTALVLALLAGQEEAPAAPSAILRGTLRPAVAPEPLTASPPDPDDTRSDVRRTQSIKRPAVGIRRAEAPGLRPPPRPAADVAVPGHEVLGPLGFDSFGEVWQVRAADGKVRLARFLDPEWSAGPQAQDRLAVFLQALRHPALPAAEVLRGAGGRAVLVSDEVGRSLRDRYRQCRDAGLPGVPRRELLDYLGTAAATLDELRACYGFEHLALAPEHVRVEGELLWVTGYGLAELARQAGRPLPASGSGPYAAPELAAGKASGSCDQYSLAVIYAELLAGALPRPGRGGTGPALDFLPAADRAVLGRALHPDPRQRFAGCVPLFQALEVAAGPAPEPAALPTLMGLSRLSGQGADPAETPTCWQFLDALVASASRANALACHWQLAASATLSRLEGDGLECRFPMKALAGMVRLKLDAFREEWGAHADPADGTCYRFLLRESPSFWQRCLGQQGGLEVEVRLLSGHGQDPNLVEVAAAVRPFGDGKGPLVQKLAAVGPQVLASLREHLQNVREKRARARRPFAAAVHVYPVIGNGERAPTLRGTCRDLSRGGIRFVVPRAPATDRAYLHFPELPGLEDFAMLAEFVRVRPGDGGECEAAAAFCLEELPEAIPL